jgi:hypothetical protein
MKIPQGVNTPSFVFLAVPFFSVFFPAKQRTMVFLKHFIESLPPSPQESMEIHEKAEWIPGSKVRLLAYLQAVTRTWSEARSVTFGPPREMQSLIWIRLNRSLDHPLAYRP